MREKIRLLMKEQSAVLIPSRCPRTGGPRCLGHICPDYHYGDLTRNLGRRCAHCDVIAAAVDRQQREKDFCAATNTRNWRRAEQLALAGRQDRYLTKAAKDAWANRLADVSRRASLG